jgi:hypothetical protein
VYPISWGELCSRYWPEQKAVVEVEPFSPNRMYGAMLDLADEMAPYSRFSTAVMDVLKWADPLWSLLCLATSLLLARHPRFIFSFLQACALVQMGRNYLARTNRVAQLALEETSKK